MSSSDPGPRSPAGRRFRRRLVASAVILIALAAIFFGGGGWYFAGQIRSDGLQISPSTTVFDLSVVAVARGSITLHEATGFPRDPTLRESAVYGLAWPGGSGVLAASMSTASDGAVTRPLTVKVGVPPSTGMRAALSTAAYTDPGSAYQAPFQNVDYDCAGGTCPAWYVPGRSTTWAIMVHGKGSTRTEGLRALGATLQAGMPALLISYRNDPGDPRDPSGYYRYGQTEWHDLENAVRYATGHGAQHVVLFGFSMGGAIVAAFMQHSALTNLVRALVLDAPMLDFRRTVDFGAAHRRLPLIDTPIPAPLTWTAESIAGHDFGINWARINYLNGRWLQVPALVFHGTADDTVPISTSDIFAKQYPQLVQEVRVAGASHVESWNIDPGRYDATTVAFLDRLRAQA